MAASIKTNINNNLGSDIQVVGTSGADTLDGGIQSTATAFYTELYGGAGNDTYYIDAVTLASLDKVVELPNGGIDNVVLVNTWNGISGYWINTATSYTLTDNVENLSLQGVAINSTLPGGKQVDTTFSTGMTVYGNALNNVIITSSSADRIYGGLGNDTMEGGGGADTYFVDSLGDKVIEGNDPYFLTGAGAATDKVYSNVDFTLGDGLENLTLDTSSGNTKGTGNGLNNQIIGSAGNNILSGLAGDDTMYGGGGNDILLGGDGNDALFSDGNSFQTKFFDHAVAGSITTLVLGGDTLDGGAGNDTLVGADGDKLLGGAGNDVLYGSFSTTPAEKMTMDGGAGNDQFMNFGIKDSIIGGAGIDTVFINFGTGPTNYTLGADVERGILASGSTSPDSLTGNALNNYLQANAGNDVLSGLAGEDVLDGAAGADTMIGGDGSDSYMVDSTGDVVIETNPLLAGGIDTVFSYITNYTLGANVENLVLEEGTYAGGNAGAANNGKGNTLSNLIIGNTRANLLEGGAGNDTLDGSAGKDTLIGGADNDTYIVDNTADIIHELADFTVTGATGTVTVKGGVDNVLLVNDSTTAGPHFFTGTSYTLTDNVENLDASAVTLAGSVTGTSFTITGNASNNNIIGTRLNDTIDGGAGNDTMAGGAGNDTYYVSEAGDKVVETIAGVAGGVDKVIFNAHLGAGIYTLDNNVENLLISDGSASKFVGNALDNIIIGNGSDNVIDGGVGNDSLSGFSGSDSLTGGLGNDTLDGGSGNDTMDGGAGNDTYIVDSLFDKVTDSAGIDTIRTALTNFDLSATIVGSSVIDNLVYTGSGNFIGLGNSLANSITGGAGRDSIDGGAGNDTLDGGVGADTLIGGSGDDTFLVDNVNDMILEDTIVGSGIKDTVISTVSYSILDTDGAGSLGGGVENLTLASTILGGAAAFNATGNNLANTITGNENSNLIDGGTGADTMVGGDGNDTYFVDNTADKVTELDTDITKVGSSAAAGTADAIYATLADGSAYTMDKFVEQLHVLQGAGPNGNINITGNDANNLIWGGVGANSISGGLGNDVINGGAGNDTLDGGAGDDTLNGDGFYQNTYNGALISSSGGFDKMTGGTGNDTYYVDVGDGAGTVVASASEDQVIEAALGGIDTVKLVGSTITAYTLDTEVENLDARGLNSSTLDAIANAKDNQIIGLASVAHSQTLVGADGNDTFILTLNSASNDTVRGGTDVLFGGATTSDLSKADVLLAKADTAGGSVVANADIKQIEAVSIDVSNMALANNLTVNFTNFGDSSNFTNAVGSLLPPTVTISGGVTVPADTTGITVGGNITLTGLSAVPSYVLSNYTQAGTTTLTLAGVSGSSDSLHVTLDNHGAGFLVSAGIETLFLTSTGDVLNNAATANALDVSGIATTAGGTTTTLIDVTGDSRLNLAGLATATAAGSQQTVFLHDYAANRFQAALSSTTGTNFLTIQLDNVETRLSTNGASLENLNLDVTGSTHANVLNLNNAALTAAAGTGLTYVSGGASTSLTLDQFTGAVSTVALASFSTGFSGKLDIIGSGAVTLTADGGDINFKSFNDATLADPNVADSFTFTGAGTFNNLDSIDGGGGADTLSALVDGLIASSTGQLHIANVETLTFQTASVGTTSIDAQFITGATTLNLAPTAGSTLIVQNLDVATVTNLSGGNVGVYLTSAQAHTVTDNSGNDTIVGGDLVDTVNITGGNDSVSTGEGNDIVNAAGSLTTADTVDGGGGSDTLSFSSNATTDLDNVTNFETIVLGANVTTITAQDTLVATGATLTVNGAAATSLVWDGSAETDGNFAITGTAAADSLTGGAGNDSFIGGAGADTIVGGAGNNTVTMLVTSGNTDSADGGSGTGDTLILSGAAVAAVTVDLTAGDQFTDGGTDTLTQTGFENLDASLLTGFTLTATAAATGSSIIGTGLADTINGGAGDDTINGGLGIDSITAAGGNDTILWDKAAADVLDGGSGIDTLQLVTTTTGNITVDLTQVVDQVSTSAGNQTGFENLDASVLTTGILMATAAASGSNIQGGGAADIITGGAGSDTLVGNAGNDTISTGGGSDILTGGLGADQFVFNTTPDTSVLTQITDFTAGSDIIDLAHTSYESLTTLAGGTLSTSEFLSGAGLSSSNVAGAVIVYNNSTGDLYYDADANGSETGVLIANLNGTPAISASDIHVV
jgi:Ca2+-binding RTX toxin-like protein